MKFTIFTLFPEFFAGPLSTGLLGKAVASGIISIECVDIRDYSGDRHRRCDDYTYGGGSGMVLRPEPLFRALDAKRPPGAKVVFPTPSGVLLTQEMVKRFFSRDDICIVCGHYEGIDQRVIDRYVDFEVSLGDYVLSGGEFAALVIVDAVSRYVPGFMSNEESLSEESFENGLLEYPHYTRPSEYEGMKVPETLLTGNHKSVEKWRLEKSIEKTRLLRPDLYREYLKRIIRGEVK